MDLIPGDWRCGVDPEAVEARLAEDREAVKHVIVRCGQCVEDADMTYG